MIARFSELPRITKIGDAIAAGRSILLHAPRFHGKRQLVEFVGTSFRQRQDGVWIALSSRTVNAAGTLEYQQLADAASRVLGRRTRGRVVSTEAFRTVLESLIEQSSKRLLITLTGSGRGQEAHHFELLATLNRLLRGRPDLRQRMQVLATDDYSTFLHQELIYRESELEQFEKEHWLPLTLAEITTLCGQSASEVAPREIAEVAQVIEGTTGGHIGLIDELFEALGAERTLKGVKEHAAIDATVWRQSHILTVVQRALEEDPLGYASTALEYRTSATPEFHSLRVDVLRELGILQRVSIAHVRLCPGVITRMIERIHDRASRSAARLGSVLTDKGTRIYEAGNVPLTDDDLVVLHLSDLHVGQKYRFRLEWPGNALNIDQSALSDLIAADLKALGLLGRVDVVVVSGDFTWEATAEEFHRARDVLRDLMARVGLPEAERSRLVLVPGNHDVNWKPGPFSAGRHGHYADFDELLRGKRPSEAGLKTVLSTSGRVRLRFVELDTNHVEGPEAAGIGFVSREALQQASELLDADDPGPAERTFTWVVIHHHVFPATSASVRDAAQRRVSVLANSSELLLYAHKWRAEVVLHGHEHQPSLSIARRWPLEGPNELHTLTSLGAGSVGVVRDQLGPIGQNQYYVICRTDRGLIIRSRWLGGMGVGFVAHEDLVLGDYATGGLVSRESLGAFERRWTEPTEMAAAHPHAV
jgi:predicted MPP superfamily phosphohydrolase